MKYSREFIESIKNQLILGVNPKTIAKDIDVSFQQVYNIIESYNIPLSKIRAEQKAVRRQARIKAKEARIEAAKESRKQSFFDKYKDISDFKRPLRKYNLKRTLKKDKVSVRNRERQQEYRDFNYIKILARRVVAYALKRRYIFYTPCTVCGSMEDLEFHHYNGYEHALDVQSLCKKCHNEEHKGRAWHKDRGEF